MRQNLIGGYTVQSTCWLVEKENLRRGDELARDGHSSFLASGQPLLDRSANDDVGLLGQTKRGQKGVDPVFKVTSRQRPDL